MRFEIKQEDGWVICRVFKKKNHTRGYHADVEQQEEPVVSFHATGGNCALQDPKHYSTEAHTENYAFDHHHHHHMSSMHLPQLMSPEVPAAAVNPNSFLPFLPLSGTMDQLQCPQNLLRLSSGSSAAGFMPAQDKFSGDWSFLDKLLASQQSMDHISKCNQFSQVGDLVPPAQRFPFPHNGFEPDFSKYSK